MRKRRRSPPPSRSSTMASWRRSPAAYRRRRPASWSTSNSAPPSCATPLSKEYRHRLPGGEERTGRIRFRIWRGFRPPHRSVRSDLLQGAGALQPGGRSRIEQTAGGRLRRLSDYLAAQDRSRFMFELLVPPEKMQLDRLEGDKKAYDLELRPRLMVEAIQELQDRRRRAGSLEDRRARSTRGLRARRGGGPRGRAR